MRVHGKGAAMVSAVVVAVTLTTLGYSAGCVHVSVPTSDAAEPFTCVEGWIATAGAALPLANLTSAAVSVGVFGAPGGATQIG